MIMYPIAHRNFCSKTEPSGFYKKNTDICGFLLNNTTQGAHPSKNFINTPAQHTPLEHEHSPITTI